MASPVPLMLAFTPLSSDASPVALGLGHDHLVRTENACGSFCLNSSNAFFDLNFNAILSRTQLPQPQPRVESSLSVSPITATTFDVSWHPFYDFVLGSGYRTSQRTSERSSGGKVVKRLTASAQEIPISVATRPSELFAIAGQAIIRNVELKQNRFSNSNVQGETYSASVHRWAADLLFQKSEATAYGISYVSPTLQKMTLRGQDVSSANAATAPQWTDPQEFTFSMAYFSSFRPPNGVTFGPFENVVHFSFTAATWDSGKPVAYAALASQSSSKDGWSLVDTSGQTEEFVFDTLDPNMAVSLGLESTWMRTAIGTASTLTHVRLNHLAAKRNTTQWQGGFGLGFSTKYFSLQASTLWRDEDAGYAIGLSSSL